MLKNENPVQYCDGNGLCIKRTAASPRPTDGRAGILYGKGNPPPEVIAFCEAGFADLTISGNDVASGWTATLIGSESRAERSEARSEPDA